MYNVRRFNFALQLVYGVNHTLNKGGGVTPIGSVVTTVSAGQSFDQLFQWFDR